MGMCFIRTYCVVQIWCGGASKSMIEDKNWICKKEGVKHEEETAWKD